MASLSLLQTWPKVQNGFPPLSIKKYQSMLDFLGVQLAMLPLIKPQLSSLVCNTGHVRENRSNF